MPRDETDYSGSIRLLDMDHINQPLPIAIALAGGSGSGKTYSALQLATGIADGLAGKTGAPIAFVDTENRRGMHYRSAFPQMLPDRGGLYVDFGPEDGHGSMIGYPPERWIALLDLIEAQGISVVVIDSFSHAWEGIKGVLELQALALERLTGGDQSKADRMTQLSWAEVKPRYRRLIDRIVRARLNCILCMRAKPVIQETRRGQTRNLRPTKLRRFDVPWDVAADKDLIFEMAAMAVMDPDHPGCPIHQIKIVDQFKPLFDPHTPITPEAGLRMAEWSRGGGNFEHVKFLFDGARAEAREGRASFLEWWHGLAKDSRAALQPILPELQKLTQEADARLRASEDDPFAMVEEGADAPPEGGQDAPAERGSGEASL